MTSEKVFSDLSAHMIKGLMVHSQLADYYKFLGLDGYSKCHEKHYKKESKNWRKLSDYYIRHYNRLIEEQPIESPQAIPKAWYQATRQEVDKTTKMKAVKSGLKLWHDWEHDTKDLYQREYKYLFENNDIAGALFIKQYIVDVDNELAEVQSYIIDKESTDYNIVHIIDNQ